MLTAPTFTPTCSLQLLHNVTWRVGGGGRGKEPEFRSSASARLVGMESPSEMPSKKKTGRQHCQHGRRRSECKDCGGGSVCQHGRRRSQCKDCGGSSICQHGRQMSRCKDCGGSSVCQHGRQRRQCKDCGGGSICQHGRQRSVCKDCGGSSDEGSMRKRDRVRA